MRYLSASAALTILVSLAVSCADASAQTTTAPSVPAQADTTSAGIVGFFRQAEIIAVADGYYDYTQDRVPGVELRNFDTRDRLLSLSMAKIGVSKTATSAQRLGFRIDLHAGGATSIIHASEPGTSSALQHVEQAYLSYLAALGKGLQIDFGEFVTQHGAEVIEAKDNWNYSRSLLFALAIPYYHMGLRATYAVNDKVSIMGAVVNGWNDVVDNNRGKTYGAQVALKPTARLSIVQNYMAGPEQPHDTLDWRQLSDTVVTYALTPALSLMANYDFGRDSIALQPVHWQGIAGYARYQATNRFAVSPRLEWYDDANGFTSGMPRTLKEITVTGETKLGAGFLWRVEYRHDTANVASFREATGSVVPGQTTIAAGVLYAFNSK